MPDLSVSPLWEDLRENSLLWTGLEYPSSLPYPEVLVSSLSLSLTVSCSASPRPLLSRSRLTALSLSTLDILTVSGSDPLRRLCDLELFRSETMSGLI